MLGVGCFGLFLVLEVSVNQCYNIKNSFGVRRMYQDLRVWHKSIELVKEIYFLTEKLPSKENYVLSDQMRRAAISIPSNVAEGNGRSTRAEYKRFVEIARGSQYELQTQLYICVELNYLTKVDTEKANELITEVGKMLNNLIKSLS